MKESDSKQHKSYSDSLPLTNTSPHQRSMVLYHPGKGQRLTTLNKMVIALETAFRKNDMMEQPPVAISSARPYSRLGKPHSTQLQWLSLSSTNLAISRISEVSQLTLKNGIETQAYFAGIDQHVSNAVSFRCYQWGLNDSYGISITFFFKNWDAPYDMFPLIANIRQIPEWRFSFPLLYP